jgi:hypothetical protein
MAEAEFDYNGVVTFFDEKWIGHDKWIAWRRWTLRNCGTGATETEAVEDLCLTEAEAA